MQSYNTLGYEIWRIEHLLEIGIYLVLCMVPQVLIVLQKPPGMSAGSAGACRKLKAVGESRLPA